MRKAILPTITHGDAPPPAEDAERTKGLPPRCTWQDDGSVRLILLDPVEQTFAEGAGTRVEPPTELHLRPLRGGDMLDAMEVGGRAAISRFLMPRSTGLTGPVGEDLLRRLDARDFVAASLVVEVFTNSGRRIGL